MGRSTSTALFVSLVLYANVAFGHLSIWTPSMLGFNLSEWDDTFVIKGDNRPVTPLMGRTFKQWWFHGHLAFPPHPDDIEQMTPGKATTFEINCDKGGTSFWPTSPAKVHNIASPDDPHKLCPGYPMSQWHTTSYEDTGGTALAVAYKSDFNAVQPEDFTVFSVNQHSPWNMYTPYEVPAAMPPCPNGKCICAWFWIHRPDSGSMQMYMTGFQCNFPGATGTSPVSKSKLARRCGPDPYTGVTNDTPSNCTLGAKTPFYWYQKEGNNMFEDTYYPPLYQDLYHFKDGAQDDIFDDSDTCGGFYDCNDKGGNTGGGGSGSGSGNGSGTGNGEDHSTKDSSPASSTHKVSRPAETHKTTATEAPGNPGGSPPSSTSAIESKTQPIGNPAGTPPPSSTLSESSPPSSTTTSAAAESSKASRCNAQRNAKRNGKDQIMGRSAFAAIASKHRRHIRNIFT